MTQRRHRCEDAEFRKKPAQPRQAVQYVEGAQRSHGQGEGDLREPLFEAQRGLYPAPETAQALPKIGPQERWQTVHG